MVIDNSGGGGTKDATLYFYPGDSNPPSAPWTFANPQSLGLWVYVDPADCVAGSEKVVFVQTLAYTTYQAGVGYGGYYSNTWYTSSSLDYAHRPRLRAGWNCLRLAHGLWNLTSLDTSKIYKIEITVRVAAGATVTTYVGPIWVESFDRPRILLIQDGGYRTFLDSGAYQQFRNLGVKTTFAVIPSQVGQSDKYTWAELQQFQANGDSVSFHSFSGDAPANLDELRAQITKSIRELEAHGLHDARLWRAAVYSNTGPSDSDLILPRYTRGCRSYRGSGGASNDGVAVGCWPQPYQFCMPTGDLVIECVFGVTITNGGTGYSVPHSVTFIGGGGSGAAGRCTVSGGSVTGVTMSNFGYGYTSAPTVYFPLGNHDATGTAQLNASYANRLARLLATNGLEIMYFHGIGGSQQGKGGHLTTGQLDRVLSFFSDCRDAGVQFVTMRDLFGGWFTGDGANDPFSSVYGAWPSA